MFKSKLGILSRVSLVKTDILNPEDNLYLLFYVTTDKEGQVCLKRQEILDVLNQFYSNGESRYILSVADDRIQGNVYLKGQVFIQVKEATITPDNG